MKLTIDFESRSRIDLKKCGAYRYAEDESTDVMCLAVKVDDHSTELWVSKKFRHLHDTEISDAALIKLMQNADVISAFNAQFERVIWAGVMVRYGFAPIPDAKWHCVAAKASAMALPRSLDGACIALVLQNQKDAVGHRIMLKLCKPRKPTKNNPNIWFEDPEEFKTLCEYCVKDVNAEYELDQILPDLNAFETKLYKIDQGINSRGVYIDAEGIDILVKKIRRRERSYLAEIKDITEGFITSTRQRDKTLVWLNGQGVQLPDLTKATVEEALKGELPESAQRLLTIRQSLAKSSVSKLAAMQRMACKDGRVKGTTVYHGASTGRWGGKGIQPHNYPRDSFSQERVDEVLTWDTGLIEIMYGCTFLAASKCLRGMLCAAPGNELICADYAAIEARVLAWLAFEQEVLDDFREGLDAYKVAASKVFKVPYESINKAQRFIGKTVVLSCLGGNTKVMTDIGWVKIKDITEDMFIWDGVEFSEHKGVTILHKDSIMSIAGIKVTEDHLFLAGDDTWETAADLKGSVQKLNEAKCMGILSLEKLLMGLMGDSEKLCVDAQSVGKYSVCPTSLISLLERLRDAMIALKKLQHNRTPSLNSEGRTIRDSDAGYQQSSGDVQTPTILLTNFMEAKASRCMNLGLEIVLNLWTTFQHLKGGMTPISPLIAWIRLEIMSLEILSSPVFKDNSSIKGILFGSSIMVRGYRLLSFIKSTAQDIASRVLFLGKSGKDFLLNKLSRAKKDAKGYTVYDIKEVGLNNRFMIMTEEGPMVVHNCGYSGWVNAFRKMANEDVNKLSDEEVAGIIMAWRYSRGKTVALWAELNDAAIRAVKTGKVHKYGLISFGMRKGFLHCRLPSGRLLAYYAPRVEMKTDLYDRTKETVTFMGIHSITKQWVRMSTYGGKICENVTQAIARDILAEALVRCEEHGYPVVLHVHDEAIAELPKGKGSLKEFSELMSVVPDWATGLPLKSEGWIGRRYRK